MPIKRPPKQKVIEYLSGLDETFAFGVAELIFDCLKAYRQDFGCLESEIICTVANKLGLDERMTTICSHFPSLFYPLQKYRRNGRNRKIRLNLSETDRIGFDCFLVMHQLERLGSQAHASVLQRTMSGCHLVKAEELKKALAFLQKLDLITEQQSPSAQWWNPRHSYYINEGNHRPNVTESGRVQRCSSTESLAV